MIRIDEKLYKIFMKMIIKNEWYVLPEKKKVQKRDDVSKNV
jgi:hypothetical protein